jgi:hypothetical protein
MIPAHHTMIDIETLGVSPGSVVLTLAAVSREMQFYDKISFESSALLGLTVDTETLAWWERQQKDIFDEARSGTKIVSQVMTEFVNHLFDIRKANDGQLTIWGNGASFDAPLLEAVFQKLGWLVPWSYKESLCYRTMAAVFPQIQKPFKPHGTHNALVDARWQFEHLAKIWDHIHGKDDQV